MKPPTKILATLVIAVAVQSPAETSALWGTNGELWSAGGRLPDFSFAGYHCGETAIPDAPPGVSVKDFGAQGDGVSDDTAAFVKAIKEVKGAIEIPAGRYLITDVLEVKRSGVVLRGAGADKTILFFQKPLDVIRPRPTKNTDGLATTAWSWSGGLVWFQGSLGEKTLAEVSRPAARGEKTLAVADATNLRAGQRVEIFQQDNPDNSLARELYSGDPGKVDNLDGSTVAKLVAHIVKIDGGKIFLDRPLRFAVEAKWHPQIRSFTPAVAESGIENVRIEFPCTPYGGHFKEPGFNAIAFSGVADCWARNLVISNADSGIFPCGHFCTIQNIVFDSARPADATRCTGHHGMNFEGCDNLFTGFYFRTRFIHDISVDHCAAGNVIASGRGVDLCLDHHERAPYENLFSDIDAGAGTRLWTCGGGAALGKHSGARETFWNIRAAKPQKLPPQNFGPPSMNFVALQTDLPSIKETGGKWLEAISPKEVFPPELHAAQLAKRLGTK